MEKLIIDNLKNFENKNIIDQSVKPGSLRHVISKKVSEQGSCLKQLIPEIQEIINCSKNWHHPRFFGYYPCNIAYPSVIASLFTSTFGSPSFTWHANPSQTEIENIVCDYLVDLFKLPSHFFIKNQGGGGFVNSITEGYFLSVNYAKLKKMDQLNLQIPNPKIFDLVAYTARSASHWCSKALYFKDIQYVRIIDEVFNEESQNYEMDYQKLEQQIKQDIEQGLIPFWMGCSLGTTYTCAFDNIEIIGKLCKEYDIILSVDAAYAGIYQILPEKAYLFKHQELIDVYMVNMAKSGLIGLVGAVLFVKDKKSFIRLSGKEKLINSVCTNVFSNSDDIIDYKDWSVGFGRKNNAFNLYLTLKLFGVNKYQNSLRKLLFLAQIFEALIKKDHQLQIISKRELGLNCFRIFLSDTSLELLNNINLEVVSYINENNNVDGYLTGGLLNNNIQFIRIVPCNMNTLIKDVFVFWSKFQKVKQQIILKYFS